MADAPGRFVWYELMTPDVEAAKVFYADVVGWGTTNALMPGSAYSFFTTGEKRICGLLELPAGARAGGAIPFWIGFIEVDDVDAAADRVWSSAAPFMSRRKTYRAAGVFRSLPIGNKRPWDCSNG